MNDWGETPVSERWNIAARRAEGAKVMARYKELVREREEKADKLVREIKEVIKQSGHTIQEVFGHGVKAPHHAIKVYTPEFIIEIIQKLHYEKLPLKGLHLSNTMVFREACKEFGGWPQAIAAAGIGGLSVLDSEVDWINDKQIRDSLIRVSENPSLKWSEFIDIGAQIVGVRPDTFRHWFWRVFGARTSTWREDFLNLIQSVDKNIPITIKRKERGVGNQNIELRPIPSLKEIETSLLELQEQRFASNGIKQESTPEAYAKTLSRLREIAQERLDALCALQENAVNMAKEVGLTLEDIFPEEFKNRNKARFKLWTPEFIIKTIQTLHSEKLPINSIAVTTTSGIMAGAYREFGGWAQAVKAAGIDYDTIRYNENAPRIGRGKGRSRWSPERLTLEIQRRYRLGLPLYLKAVDKSNPGFIWYARKYYRERSWHTALTTAGFNADEINMAGRVRPRYPVYRVSLPRNWVSIHAPIGGEPELTLEGSRRIATEDTEAIAKVDAKLVIEAILKQKSLNREMTRLLERYYAGHHLEDNEFETLIGAINSSPALEKLLKTEA